MQVKEQIKLRFKGVDFPVVHLNSSNPYDFSNNEDEDVDIDIRPKAFIPENSANLFKIIIDVRLSVKDKFSLDVTSIGHFELSDTSVDPDTRKKFINANSTAILFPYVRAFITTLTSNLGAVTKPIIIPTRFFHGDLEVINSEDISRNHQLSQ